MGKNNYQSWSKTDLIKEIERLKERKKYGLVWEDKPEDVVKICRDKLPVVKEVKSKEIITAKNKPVNLLIEGDNYHSLSVLNYTHERKVDVIYIDPPYNTGNNDFIFNDKYVDPEDGYRHSKWLSFMEKRLRLAKNLLRDTGMIFISIDDNELAQIKLLCDEIFIEKNFINVISVKSKNIAGASGGGEDKRLKKNIEYLICYAKNYESFRRFNATYKKTDLISYINAMREKNISWKYTTVIVNFGKKVYLKTIKDGSGGDIRIFEHKDYRIESINSLAKKEKLSEEAAHRKYFDSIITTSAAQSSIRKRVWDAVGDKDTLYSIEYIPRSGRNKNKLTTLFYLGEKKRLVTWLKDTAELDKQGDMERKELYGTLWDGINWNNVNREGGVGLSSGKKPVELIKLILKHLDQQDLLVLDFFAGSGTTGHAVLELNKEDGGNRVFILCTNNENNICTRVCYPRIENTIKGYRTSKGKKVEGFGSNLKYFKTDFVDAEPTDKNKKKLTEQATEMLCIKEGTFEPVLDKKEFKIFKNSDHYTGIMFDQLAIPEFKGAIKDVKGKFSVYVFSLSDETFDEEFSDIKQKIKLAPIPEAILRVYRRIFK